ncbi:conserved hypothetical protein [Lodderomyces elongisporus NRRL YB-4239]|uniref:Uncharacterized protein n=1 Tax=Lodderomyces elongisporus (strain ATCC 11503 / CBS 2605 / JCM 1781 / NBRC 1676 / NRRL YB-4239) TaxID=379508 RepID=A5DTC5_LODEL|nr:conserved hypothetical protein [Lodderomyces elongisporus NRRL YB-4239]
MAYIGKHCLCTYGIANIAPPNTSMPPFCKILIAWCGDNAANIPGWYFAILYVPQMINPIIQIKMIGANRKLIFFEPNCWIAKRMIRITSETARTLVLLNDGTAICIPPMALNTDVVGVKRPSDITREQPRKHAPKMKLCTVLIMVGCCFMRSILDCTVLIEDAVVSCLLSSCKSEASIDFVPPGIVTPLGPMFKYLAILAYIATCPPSPLLGPSISTMQTYLKMTMMVNTQKMMEMAP